MSNARDKANIPALNFSSTGIDDNATSTAITIDSSQRVGIGTSSPGKILDIRSADPIIQTVDTGDSDAVTRIDGNAGWLQFRADNNNTLSGTNITFNIDGSEKMRIKDSGNVGIGTSSPDGKVHIISDSAGTVTASTSGNDLVVEGTGATGISILSPNDQNANILFGDPDDNDTGAIQYRHSDDSLRFFLNGTSEKMQIDSSGNVGIGTVSPSSRFNILESTVGTDPTADSSNFIKLTNSDVGTVNEVFGIGFSSLSGGTDYLGAFVQALGNYSLNFDHSLIFGTRGTSGNATERMRIDGNGRVYIGTTSQITGTHNHKLGVSQTGSETPITTETDSTVQRFAIDFHNPNGRVGYIMTSASSTSYNTSSDYRLKENVDYNFDATSRLKQLKPARFNFIADANTTVDGFLAHEVSNIVPEAITGTKDAVQVWQEGDELPEGVSVGDNKLDENGNTIPEYQGIDQSKLVPLLVKTIQELEARITTLEANNP